MTPYNLVTCDIEQTMITCHVFERLTFKGLSTFFIITVIAFFTQCESGDAATTGEESDQINILGSESFGHVGFSHTFGTPETPFWLHANRDGRIPLHSGNNLLIFGGYHTAFLRKSDVVDLDAGFRLDSRLSDADNALKFTELYTHFRAYGWKLSAGRFYDTIGLNSGYLTTGSLMMSRNALQPFKLRLSTHDFLPVPLTGNHFSFKARWSEAFLTDNRFVSNARIHQKYLYLKLQPVKEIHLIGGIVHNLMWGGMHPEMGRLHGTFDDWLNDVLGQPDDRVFGNRSPLGNGLGAYDFGAEYRGRTWSAGAYRMFYIEDRESIHIRSPWDGMWGGFLDLHDGERPHRLINYITYEHINTKKQDAGTGDALGRARYYSHNLWRDGWVHHGLVLGNPLILIDPEKMGSRERIIVNNIILGHHVGLAGNFDGNLSYELLATYSRNYGICNDQTSGGSCRGSEENPVQLREDYVPFHELRRDRYSLLFKLAFPVSVLLDAVMPSGLSGTTGISGNTPTSGVASVNSSGTSTSTGAFAVSGRSHPASGYMQTASGRSHAGYGRGLQMYISVALDAGEFHSRPLFGFELGISMSL